VLYDVVAKDTCHVLFGIIWMYCRKVYHDGVKNTYHFVKDNRSFRLLPMLKENMERRIVMSFAKESLRQVLSCTLV
jgi:hypothetical protein